MWGLRCRPRRRRARHLLRIARPAVWVSRHVPREGNGFPRAKLLGNTRESHASRSLGPEGLRWSLLEGEWRCSSLDVEGEDPLSARGPAARGTSWRGQRAPVGTAPPRPPCPRAAPQPWPASCRPRLCRSWPPAWEDWGGEHGAHSRAHACLWSPGPQWARAWRGGGAGLAFSFSRSSPWK